MISKRYSGGRMRRKPKRKCHDCHKPTDNYRCRDCWAKIRGASEEYTSPENYHGVETVEIL